MKRPFYLVLASSILVADVAVAADPNDYLPVKKGLEWVANVRVESAAGSVLTGTAKIVSEEEIEKAGKRYLRERTTWDLEKVHNEFTRLTRKDETGIYSIVEGVQETAEQKEVALPLKVGANWTFTVNGKTLQVTVLGIENVTIEGKTYEECYHIRKTLPGTRFTEDLWEAPKVGTVKSESIYEDGTKMLFTLREFKSGK
jgi:hypothetical protein